MLLHCLYRSVSSNIHGTKGNKNYISVPLATRLIDEIYLIIAFLSVLLIPFYMPYSNQKYLDRWLLSSFGSMISDKIPNKRRRVIWLHVDQAIHSIKPILVVLPLRLFPFFHNIRIAVGDIIHLAFLLSESSLCFYIQT